ncbi:MAG: MFS transporter [Clostridia bacterium]|jgi:DHA3 family macrolide efflux protein-like MFS transporter
MGNWKKHTILFLASQTISLFGSSLVQFAITWYIALETQSGIMMTLSIISGFVPNMLLSPFAGVWADRYNRKILIVVSDAVIAFSTLVMAILFLTGYGSVWILIGVSAIRSFGTSIQNPAVRAFLPQIVPVDKLTRVNAVNQSVQSFCNLLSPIISGALLTVSTIENIFFIDVVTAAVAIAVLLLLLDVPAHARALEKQKTTYFADIREGLSYIHRHKFIEQYMIFFSISTFLATPAIFLTTLQVPRAFGEEVWRLTAMEIFFSVGMMLGGLGMAAWGGFRNRYHSILLSSMILAGLTVALGLAPNFWFYISFFGLIGLTLPMNETPAMVILQEKIDDEFRGRVFSVQSMISSSIMPLGMIFFGPLADAVPIEWIFVGAGVGLGILTLIMSGSKVLLEAGEPLAKAEEAAG